MPDSSYPAPLFDSISLTGSLLGGAAQGTLVDAAHVSGRGVAPQRTLATKLAETASVQDYGATGDGVTDDTKAFQAALASGTSVLFIPPGTYILSAPLVIPPTTSVYGLASPLVSNPPSAGCVLQFSAAVAGACITLGVAGGAVHLPVCLENVAIVRAGGASSTIPSGSVGVQVLNSQAAVLRGVTSYGQDIGFLLRGACPDGITAWLDACNTGRIQTSHLVIDSLPEVRVSNSRFGMNGVGDINCSEFVKITGGNNANPAGGPNTIVFTNVQWNQGQNLAASWINFASQMPNSIADTGLLQISNCYVESVGQGITSDATWGLIRRVLISNTQMSREGIQWFALSPSTSIQFWTLANCTVFGSMSLSTTFDQVLLSNIVCSGSVSLTSTAASSNAMLSNVVSQGPMKLAGPWSNLITEAIHGALTNAATGNVVIRDSVGTSFAGSYSIGTTGTLNFNYGTGSAPGCSLRLQSDGNAVLYGPNNAPFMALMGGSNDFTIYGKSGTPSLVVRGDTGAVSLNSALTTALPTSSTISNGGLMFAADACKPGEATGAGTGVPVFWSKSDSTWRSLCTGSRVTH